MDVVVEDGNGKAGEEEVVMGDAPVVSGGKQVSVAWKDLEYEVPVMSGHLIKHQQGTRRLLNGVSGCVRPGECVAVMGPSGCGKSTLLDVLTGRVRRGAGSGLTGEILINGKEVSASDMKKYSAYVMQDDALYGVLTVRENLYYSAALRLPESMSIKEKKQRVEDVIADLGLTKCADTKIGNVFFRGVSGGERRRCSIGMELLTEPSILLLDEPTSGLDAKSSRLIIELLKKLASEGRTVISTIHQPSSQVFQLFDKVLLLSQGEQVFFGPVNAAVSFFSQCGLPIPPLVNPADHFLEAINFDFETPPEGTEDGQPREPSEGEGDSPHPHHGGRPMPAHIKKIIDTYKESDYKQQLMECIDQQTKQSGNVDHDDRPAKYGVNGFLQTWYLADRTFWTYIRDPGIFWARVVMYSMMAIVLGTLYLRMGSHKQATIQDRMSVLFFSVAFLCFMSVAALPAFLIEREIFIRERRNAYYSVLPFALSHILVGIPFIFMISIAFTGVSYYMMNLNEDVEAFFYFLIVLALALMCAEGLVTSISAVVPSFIVGIAVGACLFGMYMLVCGFFLRKTDIPDYWIWFHYIVFHKYAFEGFVKNEFEGSLFDCYNQPDSQSDGYTCNCLIPDLNRDCLVEGEEILIEYQYQDVDKWNWLAVMVAMACFYYFLFYVFLRVFNTGER